MSSNSQKNRASDMSGNVTQILDALEGIRYGAVEIVIHDGRIVQIERREKLRFDPPIATP